jgi:hypothetical protein
MCPARQRLRKPEPRRTGITDRVGDDPPDLLGTPIEHTSTLFAAEAGVLPRCAGDAARLGLGTVHTVNGVPEYPRDDSRRPRVGGERTLPPQNRPRECRLAFPTLASFVPAGAPCPHVAHCQARGGGSADADSVGLRGRPQRAVVPAARVLAFGHAIATFNRDLLGALPRACQWSTPATTYQACATLTSTNSTNPTRTCCQSACCRSR